MYTVIISIHYGDKCEFNGFDFETITEAYAFLWQCRDRWIDSDYDLVLYHDSELIAVYDDYSE